MGLKLAIIQMCSEANPAENIAALQEYIERHLVTWKQQGVSGICLPENFYSMAASFEQSIQFSTKESDLNPLQIMAKKYQLAFLGGSALSRLSGTSQKPVNRAYYIDAQGSDLGHYDKIHLFRYQAQDRFYREDDWVMPGTKPAVINFQDWKIGASICFDLRFSELYRYYHGQGVDLIMIPAAFTRETGERHWHTLLRARAIESQCYVIACAQAGVNKDGRATYGHSLVVDPWGDVLLDLGDQPWVSGVVELELSRVKHVREKMNLREVIKTSLV